MKKYEKVKVKRGKANVRRGKEGRVGEDKCKIREGRHQRECWRRVWKRNQAKRIVWKAMQAVE